MLLRPLGTIERALWISDQYSAFNVVAVLQLESAPPPERVAAALAELQATQPALRMHIETRSGRPYFVEMENPSLPFETKSREDDDQWFSVAEAELSLRIDAGAGPLFRCTYPYAAERAELVFTFLHAIADAPSIAVFLHELLLRCAGVVPESPGQPELAPAVETRFPPAFRGPRLALQTAGYIIRQMGDEIGYRMGMRGLPGTAVHAGALAHILTMEIDPDLTAQLVRRARREQVTLNSLLNAAMLLALHRIQYGAAPRPLRTFSFPDLRPFVSPQIPPGSLAPYFSMLRYTVLLGEKPSLWETARRLHAQIYTSLKRGDKYAANVMSEGLMRMMTGLRSMRMGNAALSYTGASPLQQEYGSTRVCGLHGFISNIDLGPEYSAQVSLFDGRLVWDIVYLDGDMDRPRALAVAEEIQSILRHAVDT